jgi:hypothetical protein
LYFEAFAEKEARPVSRETSLKTVRALRWLAIAEGRRRCAGDTKAPAGGVGAASGEAETGLGDWVQFSRRRNQDYFGPVAWQFSMAHLVPALPLDPVVVGALVPAATATALGRRS